MIEKGELNMKKRKTIKVYQLVILVFFLVTALIGGALYIYDSYMYKHPIPSVKKLIDEKKKIDYQDKDDNKIEVEDYVNELPNYRSQYGNNDIVGKLTIPNINIDSLVVRTSNNTYYLDHNLYHQSDILGAPFFDYRNTDLVNNRQINIYGHNTQDSRYYDQLPFINLEAYIDQNIFNNYKDVYLSIDEKQIKYKIVAIKIINNSDNEHMKLLFSGDDDFLNHSNKLLQNTLYKEDNLIINKNDKLLVLQVCHYNPMGSYLLVICKEEK